MKADPIDQLNGEEFAYLLWRCHGGNTLYVPTTFSDYIGDWFVGVEEIEDGYHMEIESYRRILMCRSGYERTREHGPECLRARLDTALPPLDERFRAATWPIERSLVNKTRTAEERERYWWECRLPNKILPYLMEDLRPFFDDQLRERGYI